jgi:hypothetical protein
MQTVTTSVPSGQASPATDESKGGGIYWPALVVFGVFIGFFAIWASLDHTTPTWDGAGHALRGYQCADILQAHTAFKHKVLNLLTVNSFYPPFSYFVHGLLHLTLGDGAWIDGLARFLWYSLAGVSLYKTATTLLKDQAVGAVAAAIFYLYPGTFGVSHSILLLDMPLTAMIFFSTWQLARWYEQPTWAKTVALGFALGCTFLTKQTALMFFALPLTILFAQSCWRKNWRSALQLVCVGLIAGGCFLCWALPNLAAFKQFVGQNQDAMKKPSMLALWANNLWLYVYLGSIALSPLGLAIFSLSLFNRSALNKLWLVLATAGGALILHTVLNWIPQFRYILPATAFTAILSAAAIVPLWRSNARYVRATMLVAGVYALYVFVEMNLSPWPLPVTAAVERATGIGWIRQSYPVGMKSEPISPTPSTGDWGYDWTFNKIQELDGAQKSTLCVLPDLAELNTPGFMYYARVRRSPVQLTTYRLWSMVGYDFIDPPNLPWVRWFLLLQNSNQKAGREFCTPAAASRYQKLVTLLKTDKAFVLMGRKNIPGGGELLLYRNTATDKKVP